MKIYYWSNKRPSVYTHLVIDDFGNEIFIPGNSVAWYFLGVERALVK